MKRSVLLVLSAAGATLLFILVPKFDVAQPRGLSVTRGRARAIADAEARKLGIEVDKSWPLIVWNVSEILEKELASDAAKRRQADQDPVLGPRLAAYKVIYYRRGLEKFPEYGFVEVGRRGEVVGVVRRARFEETGARVTAEELRPRADAFIQSRAFPGAPHPVFESVRPAVLSSRTDHVFRYKIAEHFSSGRVACFVAVLFIGDKLAGWTLVEEYKDGSRFRYETGEDIVGVFVRFGTIFTLLAVLLVIFLKKYHAGEVGVGTGAFLLGAVLASSLVWDVLSMPGLSSGTNFGGLDARLTALTNGGFKFLFYDLPLGVLVFIAWSVGESFARERWSDRLASFDALLRHHALNATVGRSLMAGLLTAPAVAAAALLVAWIPVALGWAHLAGADNVLLSSTGGPWSVVVDAAIDALSLPVIAFLFMLSATNRRRLLPLGLLLALFIGVAMGACAAPVQPLLYRFKFGFGGIAAAAAVFLGVDLLAATVALFGATLLVHLLPLASVIGGAPLHETLVALIAPLAVVLAVSVGGLLTKRSISYSYEDLAPHVKRIMERERVKAEIDAANRIQAALLPSKDPDVGGTSVASHYRAATEIGGDYFDFLPLGGGRLGLAFGDVSGHGLTSGIVMAMAKSALLVQVGYDSAPARVLEVLNETVMKTAPKRILMTFFFGVLDVSAGELRFASAGHLDPYVIRAGTKRVEPLSAWGFPLGVRRRDPFREAVAHLEPGDRLVLYSDGLIEALDDDGEPFGFDRFEAVLRENGGRGPEEIKKALLSTIKRFTRNRPPEDDQTLVVVSFDGLEDFAKSA